MPGSSPDRGRARRARFWALTAGVALLHLLLVKLLLDQGGTAGDKPPPRIEVAFVRELVAAPPPAARTVQPAAARPAALAASDAAPEPGAVVLPVAELAIASADSTAAAPTVLPEPAVVPQPPEPLPALMPALMPALVPALVSAPMAAAASASAAAAFEWPPSTQMNYRLSGHYRGAIDGSARVEWLRSGQRYQVRMSTSVGPMLSRNIVSEGEIGDAGLVPRRFDGEQKVLFRAARRWSLRFGPDRVVLSDGREVDTLPGAQDEASQFVQLTWLFSTQPERLQVGRSVDLPLAISRKLERWTYDVVAEELLQFSFGAVPTFHVKPRREASGGDLSAEIWFAPTLQYLPVRILIRQPPDSWVDLSLISPPLQASVVPPAR